MVNNILFVGGKLYWWTIWDYCKAIYVYIGRFLYWSEIWDYCHFLLINLYMQVMICKKKSNSLTTTMTLDNVFLLKGQSNEQIQFYHLLINARNAIPTMENTTLDIVFLHKGQSNKQIQFYHLLMKTRNAISTM